ncbi:AbgT family transporter [Kocuria rhizophila]|nr:AbgT family transporter [Kocuria rhizophila]
MGNELPEPFALFTVLFLITAVVSTAMAWAGVVVQVPGQGRARGHPGPLLAGMGGVVHHHPGGELHRLPPLVTVADILLAIGIAEKSGFLAAAIRFTIGSAPRWMLPYTVGFVGVVAGSIMADSAFVVIPPLAALAFKAAGRHPVAGLLGGFAAAGPGTPPTSFPHRWTRCSRESPTQ